MRRNPSLSHVCILYLEVFLISCRTFYWQSGILLVIGQFISNLAFYWQSSILLAIRYFIGNRVFYW
jgi:hypothetical protein